MSSAVIFANPGARQPANALPQQEISIAKDGRHPSSSVVRLGPPTTFLKTGLSKDEVVRLLGDPESSSENNLGESHVSTFVFRRSGGRVLIADFRDDLLVNYRIQPVGMLASDR